MAMDWIRTNYRVPAKRGGRIEYTGGSKPQLGTITSATNGRLNIRLDGRDRAAPFHPTWQIRYLDTSPQSGGPDA